MIRRIARTYLHQTACHLSRIHRVDASRHDLSFLPKQEALARKILERRPVSPKDEWNEGRIRRALERVWPFPRSNPDVLLHGDFWPGNLLWKEGGLVAVIDWEDAALGDPLADVANARLEILWAFGDGSDAAVHGGVPIHDATRRFHPSSPLGPVCGAAAGIVRFPDGDWEMPGKASCASGTACLSPRPWRSWGLSREAPGSL